MSVTLHWTRSNSSLSYIRESRAKHSTPNVSHQELEEGKEESPRPPSNCWQHYSKCNPSSNKHTFLTFLTTRSHCWLMFDLMSKNTQGWFSENLFSWLASTIYLCKKNENINFELQLMLLPKSCYFSYTSNNHKIGQVNYSLVIIPTVTCEFLPGIKNRCFRSNFSVNGTLWI